MINILIVDAFWVVIRGRQTDPNGNLRGIVDSGLIDIICAYEAKGSVFESRAALH